MSIDKRKLVPTAHPGIRRRPRDGALVVLVRQLDPRTGRRKEVMRVLVRASMREAIAERAAIVDDIQQGKEAPADQQKRETLSGYARRWLVRKKLEKLRPHTIKTYLDALERHILPHLGDVYVDGLTSRHIMGWRDWAASRLMSNGKAFSAWSLASWFSVLRNIVKDAVLEYDLPRDPCHGVRGVKKPRAPRATRYLTAQQVREFLRLVGVHCPQHYAITLILAVYGLRWEEASALHTQHLDRETGELRVVQAQVRRKLFPTKNESHKMLPLSDEVIRAVDGHREMLRVRRNPGLEKGLLFPDVNGDYRLPSSVLKGWTAVSRAMNLAWNVTPHDLRRSYQNMLRQASVNLVVQQALMGHSSDAMTMHYSHVEMGEKRAAQDKIINLLQFKNAQEQGK